MLKPVSIGICGLGTVGAGTLDVLRKNADEIARRAGREIAVTHVAIRSPKPHLDLKGIKICNDALELAKNPEVDVLVELIGGCDAAYQLVCTAIDHGKHVVTANKALIAEHGNELFDRAQKQGVTIDFEAAVAGGIPIIKAVREGFSGNQIDWLAGIINGTGNFILTEMRDKGRAFDDVLAEAQMLGYAEADPTFDVEGIDAAHKLTILASVAFGIPLQFKGVYTEGITRITSQDVNYAEELGYRIKHLGIARRAEKGIELRVHPTLVPEDQLLSSVDGVMNAVMVHGNAVGPTLYYGAGAGAGPTASAVVADIVDVVRSLAVDAAHRVPHLAFQPDRLSDVAVLPIEDVHSAYYLRIEVLDRPGVMAAIARILSETGISIEAIIQKEPQQEGSEVTIILLVRKVVESMMNLAIDQIESLESTLGSVFKIRVDTLED